ncbi:MAG: lamin tail domain-containing protein, partial [Xanthomonadaceae bacterium]|nr:lamin tail domain-containing protein [Xanthomonadaceae bacterium]
MRSLRVMPAIAGVVLMMVAICTAEAQYLRVYYPDIEQGSATVVVSPTGRAVLVDAGTGIRGSDEGIEDFINDLIDSGIISSLDFIVATHYDEDHIGRMENVFQFVPLPPTVITYDRGEFIQVPSTFAYGDYAFGASMHNRTTVPACTEHDLGGGASFRIWTVNGEVCNGPVIDVTGASQFENNVSVSLVVTLGDVDIWIGGDLTGNPDTGVADIETPTGMELMDVDVYTVNHHGSETSSNASFLNDLAAEVAINQNSMANNFGHPRAVVVSRIKATPDSFGQTPVFFQQNPGDLSDDRSDDSLADGIADCDDAAAGGMFGLPGTIHLISDGSSYRIHACGIAPRSFPADSGAGLIGDYPPAIRAVVHNPRVPLASEAVTVEADLDQAESAEVRYWVDGLVQPTIAMSLSTGNTWVATIPPQADGARVDFRIVAGNSPAGDELSPSACYFAGVTPIALLRAVNDQGVLSTRTCAARIEGVMTAEPGLFNDFVTIAYVQDASGGLQIFDSRIDPAIGRGDRVEWIGEVEQFGGQAELVVAEPFGNFGFLRLGTGTVPTPQVVTVAELGEAIEGRLIRLNNITISSGSIPEAGNGNLVITDNGIDFATLRIDDTTDLPGSNTPTEAFDVIGIASQFDSWVPLNSGYQILPRGKADLITSEINFPQVIINELLVDPASGLAGDANGDGVRSATNDEFVELLNTGTTAVDISGWTLSDSTTTGPIRHSFPPGSVIPPREAVVVFGGGNPTGAFGTAAAGGRVFVASSGGLSLNNSSGHAVTLADAGGSIVQSVIYDGSAVDDQSIVRSPDFANAPFARHSSLIESDGALFSPGTRVNGEFFTIPSGSVVLSEVLYDPSGADSGLEWIELFNTTEQALSLDDLCIGSGGNDYTNSLIPLDACDTGACRIPAGGTFVLGGPVSALDNANPVFDMEFQFSPGLQNSGATADGVALFNLRCAQVGPQTVPVDSVIYGETNSNGLLDAAGHVGAVNVADAGSGQSIQRTGLLGQWQIQPVPDPGVTGLGSGETANTAPEITILTPASGASFSFGSDIGFSASAIDLEDGDLGTTVVWSSSLDGIIGSGASIQVSGLGIGSHSILASVSDLGGLLAEAVIEISITEPPGGAAIVLSEVFYDASGSDDGLEWVELFNAGSTSVDLTGWCLAAGGTDYTWTKFSLATIVGPETTVVVGGPISSLANASPVFAQADDFSPDIQNSGSTADGVALFNLPCSLVDAQTIPV